MTYNLAIDDERSMAEIVPEWAHYNEYSWVLARSSDEAIAIIQARGLPAFMSLDFDLGFNDNILKFIKRLRNEGLVTAETLPPFRVHSAYSGAAAWISDFLVDVGLTKPVPAEVPTKPAWQRKKPRK